MQAGKKSGSDSSNLRNAGVILTGVVAAIATHKVLDQMWRVSQQSEPPERPATGGDSWRKALSWTAATSVAAGAVRLLAREAIRPSRKA